MDLDESTLCNQFIEATKIRRQAFLQHLEDKYVANQDDSDIIDIKSLRIIKNKGHIQRIKDPLEFGSMKSYSCKKGRKILKILRRKVRIKRKYRLTIYNGGESSSYATEYPLFSSIDDCFVNQITAPICNNATLEKKTSNRKPKLVDIKSPKFLTKQIYSYRSSLRQEKYLSFISSEFSVCDLSLSSRRYLGNDDGKFRPLILPKIKKPRFEKSKTGKTYFCSEFEEEMNVTEEIILSDDINGTDNYNFRTKNSRNSLPVIEKTQKYIRLSKNEKPHLLMNNEELDFTKKKVYDNVKNNYSKSMCSLFDNLNTSNPCFPICANISSKINRKHVPCESDILTRKSLESSKEICSSSHSLQSCSTSPLSYPGVSKSTRSYKLFTKRILSDTDFIN